MKLITFNIGESLRLPTYLTELSGLGTLASVLLSSAIVIAGLILLFLIIFAGFNMLSAQGDPQKFQQAQNILTYAVLGLILIIASYFIVRIVEQSLSINILNQ